MPSLAFDFNTSFGTATDNQACIQDSVFQDQDQDSLSSRDRNPDEDRDSKLQDQFTLKIGSRDQDS